MSAPETMIDQASVTDPDEGMPPPTETSEEDRRRRRRLLLLLLLGVLLLIFAIIGGWYLLNRKPITEMLPPISETSLPTYSFSIYGTGKPMGVAVSPSGDRIYVAETEGQRTIHVFDGKGQPITTFSPPRSIPEGRVPMYIAIEPATGDVYVSDRMARKVYVFDKDGAYRRIFEPKPAMPDLQPLGLAFDPQGHLYVGDLSAPFHRVHEFSADGTLVRTIGDADQFSFPNGLATSTDGSLLVADGNHGRVDLIDGTGRQVQGIRGGVAAGELGLPRGLAVDDTGRLYVVDTTGQGVNVYRLDQQKQPEYIGFLGAEGKGDGQFEYPAGIAVDTRGRIYVADWANDRVQVWSY